MEPGAYQTAYPIYSSYDGTLVVGQAHNDYLQIVADAGIFRLVIALWFIFLVARDTLRASRHGSRVMSATALGAGAACSPCSFTACSISIFRFPRTHCSS